MHGRGGPFGAQAVDARTHGGADWVEASEGARAGEHMVTYHGEAVHVGLGVVGFVPEDLPRHERVGAGAAGHLEGLAQIRRHHWTQPHRSS